MAELLHLWVDPAWLDEYPQILRVTIAAPIQRGKQFQYVTGHLTLEEIQHGLADNLRVSQIRADILRVRDAAGRLWEPAWDGAGFYPPQAGLEAFRHIMVTKPPLSFNIGKP